MSSTGSARGGKQDSRSHSPLPTPKIVKIRYLVQHPWVPVWEWGSCTAGVEVPPHPAAPVLQCCPQGAGLPPTQGGRDHVCPPSQPHRCQHCVIMSRLSPLTQGEVWGSPSLSHRDEGGAGCCDKDPTLLNPRALVSLEKEGLQQNWSKIAILARSFDFKKYFLL